MYVSRRTPNKLHLFRILERFAKFLSLFYVITEVSAFAPDKTWQLFPIYVSTSSGCKLLYSTTINTRIEFFLCILGLKNDPPCEKNKSLSFHFGVDQYYPDLRCLNYTTGTFYYEQRDLVIKAALQTQHNQIPSSRANQRSQSSNTTLEMIAGRAE